ncbi:hypothetical protein WA026_009897 [Henosepilachna vigintioctopunctata]|uniref:NADH dehydrogenase subunit 6 n=1 Tax=Henosepilachna vigintioctopunctata TaxID=420089 RepID=A0AAW1TT30_9CUCU
MVKKFCFCFGFKNGAVIMCFASFITGVALIIDCALDLQDDDLRKYDSFLVIAILMGIASILAGGVLTVAIIKAKERYILLYMLTESVLLLIATIYSGMFVFSNAAFLFVIVICVLLWIGIYGLYGFYEEILEYNSAKPGVYEINYKNNETYVSVSPNGAMENTAV